MKDIKYFMLVNTPECIIYLSFKVEERQALLFKYNYFKKKGFDIQVYTVSPLDSNFIVKPYYGCL